jgi:endonuclease/exonuclease/phosphatase family metal-dependent hydrolase
VGKRNDFHLAFLTWNIYIGADLSPLITGPSPQRVTEVFRQFLATNFPVRAKAIASEIASKKPDLIGLQEAARWVLKIPEFGIVIYDFVKILLDELKERGLHYEVAAENENLFAQAPDSNGNTISFLDRDVILIRKENRLKVIDKQEARFVNNLIIGPFVIFRGWSAIDVKLGRHVFRMINTHLEPLNESIRNAQAMEILNGPANTNLPLILTGDINAIPGSSTYNLFVNAGFQDVWNEVGEGPGFTAHQDADLLNNFSELSARIDYIFFKNGWKPIEVDLVGEEQSDRTATGLWPSDHAGVTARLKFKGSKFD